MRVFAVLALLCGIAAARPGGGQSFSSPHTSSSSSHSSGGSFHTSGGTYHSSSGGGGGGGGSPIDTGALIGILIAGGLVLLIIVVVTSRASSHHTWTSSRTPPEPPPRLDLTPITAGDPDFSRTVFEDFVYQLYATAQRVRNDPNNLARLAPYLSAASRDLLARRGARIEQVVVGSLRIVGATLDPDGSSRVVVAIEANLARRDGTLAAKERWAFVRARGVKTKPPERTRTWPCPNCGAPWQPGSTPGTCSYCQAVVEGGRFDWSVDQIYLDAETPVGPTLTGTVEEIGNDFPTIREPDAQTQLMQLRQQDPNVTWEALGAHIQMIYTRLNDAWNAQELTPVRGLVTSSLLSYLVFWIDEYKRQRLVNKHENVAIKHLSLARVTRDRYYDAITVRVYAMGLDFTLDGKGKVVGGSKTANREYTEYWTLLRSSARRGPIVNEPRCPNCGAPLAISDLGACTHCGSEVESGSFDWVLSKIEQDDVYRG